MFPHYGSLRTVLLKHLLGIEPENAEQPTQEWDHFRARVVAEFLPESESPRLIQRQLAELETGLGTPARLSLGAEF